MRSLERDITMKRFTFVLLLMLLVITQTVPAAAQTDSWWEDGCDPRAAGDIASTTDVLDYNAACEVYRTCDPTGQGDALCQMQAFEVLLNQCAAGDSLCIDAALLYAAAILAYDMPFGESVDWIPPQTVIDGVPQALTAFMQEDFSAALAAYELTTLEDFFGDSMLPLSRAIVQARLGETDAALQSFEAALSYTFGQPLVHYARAQVYGALGRTDEASFDAAALNALRTPEIASVVDPLVAQYPLDQTVMQEWLVYPIESIGYGVAGTFHADRTLEPAQPAQIGYYPDLNVLVLIGVSRFINATSEDVQILQILQATPDSDVFALEYPTYWDNGGNIRLTMGDGIFIGNERIQYFEGAANWRFMVAPADAPNPRLDINGTRYCTNGVISRLRPGITVNSAFHSGEIQMRDVPGSDFIIGEPSEVMIIGNPTCVDNALWWEAESDNVRGWVVENSRMEHLIMPPADMQALFFCPDTPAIRLFSGVEGVVVSGLGDNNLREAADVESALLGSIPENGRFTVNEGPVCADGLVWWQVEYDGVVGWTAEGSGDTYWLAPLLE